MPRISKHRIRGQRGGLPRKFAWGIPLFFLVKGMLWLVAPLLLIFSDPG